MSQKNESFLKRNTQEAYLIVTTIVLLVIVFFLAMKIITGLSTERAEISSQTVATPAPSLQLSSIAQISNEKPNVQMIISAEGTIEASGTVSNNGVRSALLKSLQTSFANKFTSEIKINPKSGRVSWENAIPDIVLYAQKLSNAQITLRDSTVVVEGNIVEDDPQLASLKQTFNEPQFSEVTLTILNTTK